MPPVPNDTPPSNDDTQQPTSAPNSTATSTRASTPSRIDGDEQDEDDTSRMPSSFSQPGPSNPDSSEEEKRPAHHSDLALTALLSANSGRCHADTDFLGARSASGGLGLGGSFPQTRGGFESFDGSRNTERRDDGTSSGGGGARAEGEEATEEGSASDDRAPTPENEGNEEDRE
ncbi:hypothetical protein L202_03857 [Cryptococcus amylolentus CBS 6039]|uniref:Uncharacterized protein n=2 Tax=Cryptococcus amylolentus TaxID=104669 RepID=A0A1E3HUG8_9TREE|nr:hypothetical protein L202_03857 [Cryptococcus amylolentus CBS 6039]ODN79987.1 hypothetical protein L202_03857 [Cryptococcus amylolentus CBS 6039]ODO08226.1 hypothetical protein I350_03815 [Cryptococcus amylolentus CBS 6273]